MNRTNIYSRTAKGDQAAVAAHPELGRDLNSILSAIDGRSTVEALRGKLDYLSATELDEGLAALAAQDLIRESTDPASASGSSQPAPADDEHQRKAQELRAKIKARRGGGAERPAQEAGARAQQSDEQARLDHEEQAAREAAEHARREAEEKLRREAAERARREAEDQARREAEEKLRREAAERVRREAEEQARREAEEKLRREAAERSRREAEEQARREAEEKVRREDAERARQAAEVQAPQATGEGAGGEEAERSRLRAEAQVRLMAEEQAWLEAEEKIRSEEAAEAGKLANAAGTVPGGKAGSGKSRKWGKTLALGLGVLAVAALAAIHLISFDGQIPQFEKSAAAQFQQPVKIKALHLSLLPQPHLRLEGVSVGSEGQIRVARIKAAGELGNLFNEKKVFKSVELDSPVVTEEGLRWILFGKPVMRDLVLGNLSAVNASLDSKSISLPAFDAKLQSDGEGAWKTMVVESADKSVSLELTSKGPSVQLQLKAKSFKIPFGSTLALDEFFGKGTADGGGIALTEFKGFVHGGTLSGNARLRWGANWTLAGEFAAKQLDTALLFPELLSGGRLAGDASYAMQAADPAQLFATPRLEGNFSVPWGTLLGIDLGRLLQGGGARGETKFTELSGSFVHERGATQLQQLRLSQGAMSASGAVDVDAERNVRGRLSADLKLSSELRRGNLTVSGTLGKMEWRRQ